MVVERHMMHAYCMYPNSTMHLYLQPGLASPGLVTAFLASIAQDGLDESMHKHAWGHDLMDLHVKHAIYANVTALVSGVESVVETNCFSKNMQPPYCEEADKFCVTAGEPLRSDKEAHGSHHFFPSLEMNVCFCWHVSGI